MEYNILFPIAVTIFIVLLSAHKDSVGPRRSIIGKHRVNKSKGYIVFKTTTVNGTYRDDYYCIRETKKEAVSLYHQFLESDLTYCAGYAKLVEWTDWP